MTDAAVEIWHCDALGRYSGFPPPDYSAVVTAATAPRAEYLPDDTFLRGRQPDRRRRHGRVPHHLSRLVSRPDRARPPDRRTPTSVLRASSTSRSRQRRRPRPASLRGSTGPRHHQRHRRDLSRPAATPPSSTSNPLVTDTAPRVCLCCRARRERTCHRRDAAPVADATDPPGVRSPRSARAVRVRWVRTGAPAPRSAHRTR